MEERNNAYFHASVREKNKISSILQLMRDDGSYAKSSSETEKEVLSFYKRLAGQKAATLKGWI